MINFFFKFAGFFCGRCVNINSLYFDIAVFISEPFVGVSHYRL